MMRLLVAAFVAFVVSILWSCADSHPDGRSIVLADDGIEFKLPDGYWVTDDVSPEPEVKIYFIGRVDHPVGHVGGQFQLLVYREALQVFDEGFDDLDRALALRREWLERGGGTIEMARRRTIDGLEGIELRQSGGGSLWQEVFVPLKDGRLVQFKGTDVFEYTPREQQQATFEAIVDSLRFTR